MKGSHFKWIGKRAPPLWQRERLNLSADYSSYRRTTIDWPTMAIDAFHVVLFPYPAVTSLMFQKRWRQDGRYLLASIGAFHHHFYSEVLFFPAFA